MRLLAAIADLSVARPVLECLALSARATPLASTNEIDLKPVAGDSVFGLTRVDTQWESVFNLNQTTSADEAPVDES